MNRTQNQSAVDRGLYSSVLQKSPVRWTGTMMHIAAWGILFCMPFMLTGRESQSVSTETYLRFIVGPLSFMFIFYINYFWLIKKYLFRKRTFQFILLNILLIITVVAVVHLIMHFLPTPDGKEFPDRPFQQVVIFYLGHAMAYVLVAGLSVAIRMTGYLYRTETARIELERSKSEAELQNLKSQLNPHFLFNTLNNIYSLIAFSPERAQEAVHDLSRLLRYVLYESSQPEVALNKELDFIKNYVDLMRIRLPENVEVSVNISPDLNPATPIAPLLFISLIENAFKHGTSSNKSSFIRLDIKEQDGQISCVIENSHFPKDAQQDKSGSGIGLVNLQKRLALLYPNKHLLSCGVRNDVYKSKLIIQPRIEIPE